MTPRVRLPDIVQMAGRLTSSCSCVQQIKLVAYLWTHRSRWPSLDPHTDHIRFIRPITQVFLGAKTPSRAIPTARAPNQSKSIVGMTNPSESRGVLIQELLTLIIWIARMKAWALVIRSEGDHPGRQLAATGRQLAGGGAEIKRNNKSYQNKKC